MIKSYCVSITEVDDKDDALVQLKSQLNDIPLLTNTLAVIITHDDFVVTGLYKVISKELPFPNIGATSMSLNSNGICDTYIMSIIILTSDTCSFSYSVSDIISNDCNLKQISQEAYLKARTGLDADPVLGLLYVPFLSYHTAGEYLPYISELQPSLPIFGKSANDDNIGAAQRNAKTLINGESYLDRFVLALISGNIKPKFYIASVTEKSVSMADIGEITASKGNKMLEVNNVPVIEFLKKYGVMSDEKSRSGILTSTFVLRSKDGSNSVSRAPSLIDEEGIYFAGLIETGRNISIAFPSADVVTETANELSSRIAAENEGGTVIVHSCIGRRYGLVSEPFKEFHTISDAFDNKFTYVISYANGEICPTCVSEEKAENNEHNHTLIACVI